MDIANAKNSYGTPLITKDALLLPPLSAITPSNSGNPVIAVYPNGSLDNKHRIVLEFNDPDNLFFNNGPAVLFNDVGGVQSRPGWANSYGCVDVSSLETALTFRVQEETFGYMTSGNSVNAEDYITMTMRCKFREPLAEGTRYMFFEIYSDNVYSGNFSQYCRNALAMVWNNGVLQIELWNSNTAAYIIWPGPYVTNLMDGEWHLLEWRTRPGNSLFNTTSVPVGALWIDGKYIAPSRYQQPGWNIRSYGNFQIKIGCGYHPDAEAAETNSYGGVVPTATFSQFCPMLIDEFTLSNIKRHENNEDYTPDVGPLAGDGGPAYMIATEPVSAKPVKVSGNINTVDASCDVVNVEKDSNGKWNVSGKPYSSVYNIRTAEADNVFQLYPPYCALGFGSEDCTNPVWKSVTPIVKYQTDSLVYEKPVVKDSQFEIVDATTWEKKDNETGYRWKTSYGITIASSSYYEALTQNWATPPLRIECEDPNTGTGFMIGGTRHGASYGKYLRGWRFVGSDFIFVPQTLIGTMSGSGFMMSLWFRPDVDGPSSDSQCLFFSLNQSGRPTIVSLSGNTISVTVAGSYGVGTSNVVNFQVVTPKETLLDGNYHQLIFQVDRTRLRCRVALDGIVEYKSMLEGGIPSTEALNSESNFFSVTGHTSDHIIGFSTFGAMVKDAFWGNNTDVQQAYPMINFYQGDMDEFISWADPDIKTDGEFEQVVSWLWNSGNGYFYPGVKGTVTDAYTPSVGDTGVVLSGIFIPTGPTLANAIAKLSSTPETENPNQTTDDPIISSIDSDKFNTSHGTEYIDAWVGPIELVCHGEKGKLNYKCTHTANATEGEPSSTTVLHELLVNKCTLLYTEGTGTSRVWCGSASMTTTSTTYDPESGSFTQTTDDKKVLDAVLAWDDGEQKWKITLTQTEPTGPGTGFEPKTCSGTMYLYGDLPITNKWSGGRYDSTTASEYTWITDDFTTYMVDTTTEAND